MLRITRKALVVTGTAVAACAAAPRLVAWAQDKMAPDRMEMADEQMDRMKVMAADPAQAQQITMEQARMMVMDQMAMQMAQELHFQRALAQAMSDPKVKKAYDDAKQMARDPAQTAKLQQEIMADGKSMQMVTHMAERMSTMQNRMMHDAMSQDGMMHDDGKMQDGKMKDISAGKK